MKKDAVLVWFRNDLRIADNAALYHACQTGKQVIAVYFDCQQQWQQHDLSARRLQLTQHALNSLGLQLATSGIELQVMRVDLFAQVTSVMSRLLSQCHIVELYFNAEYGLDESQRDNAVRQMCHEQSISVQVFPGQCILPPGSVMNAAGQPYKKFTPFKNRWLAQAALVSVQPLPPPHALAPALQGCRQSFAVLLERSASDQRLLDEKGAHDKLKRFLASDVVDYAAQRDIPSVEGTSRLSACLTVGLLSLRQCVHGLFVQNEGTLDSSHEGLNTWLTELIWREFYLHVMAGYPEVCRGLAFREHTDQLQWRHDKADFQRWCEGQTGFPLVDAGMRQLNASGWMHNRLRMVTAMFLCKYLRIDWRWGERYFMRHLEDGHFASNNGGWQWCASTGTDSVPYFRLLSPVRQAQRFDPQAYFIKQWIPELSSVPAKIIHQPGHPQLLANGYCEPMVDLAIARKNCLAMFEELRSAV